MWQRRRCPDPLSYILRWCGQNSLPSLLFQRRNCRKVSKCHLLIRRNCDQSLVVIKVRNESIFRVSTDINVLCFIRPEHHVHWEERFNWQRTWKLRDSITSEEFEERSWSKHNGSFRRSSFVINETHDVLNPRRAWLWIRNDKEVILQRLVLKSESKSSLLTHGAILKQSKINCLFGSWGCFHESLGRRKFLLFWNFAILMTNSRRSSCDHRRILIKLLLTKAEGVTLSTREVFRQCFSFCCCY